MAWSPDGQLLASGTDSQTTIRLWHTQTRKHLRTFREAGGQVNSLSWSPKDPLLASGNSDSAILLWNTQTGELPKVFIGHSDSVLSVAFCPDGQTLASGSVDETIKLWDLASGKELRTHTGHSNSVHTVAWSPDGQLLASGSTDRTIRLWNASTGRPIGVLEGHTTSVRNVSFSLDGKLLASISDDGSVRFWQVSTREEVALLLEQGGGSYHVSPSTLAFHPHAPVLATFGGGKEGIHIWNLDIPTILENASKTPSVHYTNAKVVLVGDSGVGKSGLCLVLTKQPFSPTESTHGRHVWTFDNRKVKRDDKIKETRETLLWDLAGQPGYRIIHQLHLNDITVTLVVFDAHSETDPFAGVNHWVRALNTAQRLQGSSAVLTKKFLVAARIDRGGKSVSRERIEAVTKESGFDGYFETSAKEGINIGTLIKAIKDAIDWEKLPKVTSNELFQRIKAFLVAENKANRLLSSIDDLYHTFLKSKKALTEFEELRSQFETCIRLVESNGLIRRLSFGDLVLLQPELLDAYASALVNTVRDEPDGLGSIAEEKAKAGNFMIPKDERIPNPEQEKLLLIAMIEDLLRYELALREPSEDGTHLVFPSQSTRENPNLPDPEGKAVIFSFEGPVSNIYATLAVRLSHSGLFIKQALWKNAAIYTSKLGGTYGIYLHNIGEGRAQVTLFYDKAAREETCFHFEEFIKTHLQRKALPETLTCRRIFVCPDCKTSVEDLQATRRRERGFDWIRCNVCDTKISLLDAKERLTTAVTTLPSSRLTEMSKAADNQRDREVAKSTLEGKIATQDFDVFLCHHRKDKQAVKQIGERLKLHGILPWLDEWELRPGLPWQRLLEEQISQIKAAAVFAGKDGLGPWQNQELDAFLREFVRRGCPVIPVLLADAPQEPALPVFLKAMTWVDFRIQAPDPMQRLLWGITGKQEM